MAEIVGRPKFEVSATLKLDEGELRALDALVGYGDDAFIKNFYEKLGKAYMQKYEQDLRRLFKSVRDQVPPILSRADKAREAMKDTP